MVEIAIKRVYDEPGDEDGARILVDRLWPRGIRKNQLPLDNWCKDLAPSVELRRWFGHDAEKWPDFRRRYRAELAANKLLAEKLLQEHKQGRLTLLYGAKDRSHNHALVLRDYLHHIDHP